MAPFHDDCYARALKGCQTLIIGNSPINGVSGNILTVLATILAVIALATRGLPSFLGLVLLTAPGFRLYSYLAFERHLD